MRIQMVCVLLVLAACQREERAFTSVPPAATPDNVVQTTDLQAGPKSPNPAIGTYQENRFAVSEGMTYYEQFNCAGCHAPGGGGGMGPPLNDDEWIYGSDPENIFDTIVKGRPNGMPSFRGKINNRQVWQLAAYVRSMSGLTPKDTWVTRADHMQEVRPDRKPKAQRMLP